MSILIKGMEMPKNCFDCPLFDDVYTDADGNDDYICGLGVPLDYYQASWESKKDCPLVYVPPHGRLGDLDSLALLVLNWISTQEKAYSHEDSNALAWRLGAKAMGNQIYRDIKAYPTIIQAEPKEEETK